MVIGYKDYILSTMAGILSLAQLVLTFLLSAQGIQALRLVGYASWLLSAVCGWLPIMTLRRKGGVPRGSSYINTTCLVTTGIYSLVRHPQYAALPLLNLGMMLISQHWVVVAAGVPAIIMFYLDAIRADAVCIAKFGEPYKQYMREVPRMNLILGTMRSFGRLIK